MRKISQQKLEEVFRNLGMVFFSSGIIGFFFDFSILGSFCSINVGSILIWLGIKEDINDYRN